jgi:hypothetical protein
LWCTPSLREVRNSAAHIALVKIKRLASDVSELLRPVRHLSSQEWLSSGLKTWYMVRTGESTKKASASLATYIVSNPRSVPPILHLKDLAQDSAQRPLISMLPRGMYFAIS